MQREHPDGLSSQDALWRCRAREAENNCLGKHLSRFSSLLIMLPHTSPLYWQCACITILKYFSSKHHSLLWASHCCNVKTPKDTMAPGEALLPMTPISLPQILNRQHTLSIPSNSWKFLVLGITIFPNFWGSLRAAETSAGFCDPSWPQLLLTGLWLL